MMTVQIDVYDPLLMPDVGCALAQETPISGSAGPGWFSSFFDALNEPNLNSLLLLQKAISDIDLPPETTESLERAISEEHHLEFEISNSKIKREYQYVAILS